MSALRTFCSLFVVVPWLPFSPPSATQAKEGSVDPWVGHYTLYLPHATLDQNRKGFLAAAAQNWEITKTKEGYRVKGASALEHFVFKEVRPGVLKNKDGEDGVELLRGVCDFPGDRGRVVVQVSDHYRDGFLIGPSELERKVQALKVK
ncbi:MAG: hypothetical protein U0793_05240 [Gemmataceae bacterium]